MKRSASLHTDEDIFSITQDLFDRFELELKLIEKRLASGAESLEEIERSTLCIRVKDISDDLRSIIRIRDEASWRSAGGTACPDGPSCSANSASSNRSRTTRRTGHVPGVFVRRTDVGAQEQGTMTLRRRKTAGLRALRSSLVRQQTQIH